MRTGAPTRCRCSMASRSRRKEAAVFRILPITLVAMMLAIPLQIEVLVEERGALAGVSSALGFGNHPRPWAEDLIGREGGGAAQSQGPESAAAQKPDPGPAGSETARAAVCAPSQPVDEGRLARLLATERRVQE